MSKTTVQSSWINRYRVKMKLRTPTGVRLSKGETEALVDIQQKDIEVLKGNQQQILAAIGVARSIDSTREIVKITKGLAVAASTYKRTKDPIKKREWARRLVVAHDTRGSLVGMRDRMAAARDRLEMIKGDMELQIIEAEARVVETTAYAKAGEQLRLAGQALVSARTRAKSSTIEYTNLEITMEGAERMISADEPEDLLAQADAIIGGKDEDD